MPERDERYDRSRPFPTGSGGSVPPDDDWQAIVEGEQRHAATTTFPLWSGIVVLAGMMLWTLGPWVGGAALVIAAMLWSNRRADS
ncbi:hypothetical protein [Pseudonocardia sp.]|uniref:hypothetical protein n=1 Tax=Pseudonocardia sp. TaxID=60912 RepID=UPI002637D177|nr:hypothetical protein [Pseudonocardia sp.]